MVFRQEICVSIGSIIHILPTYTYYTLWAKMKHFKIVISIWNTWPIINSIWILLGNFTCMSIWTHLLITYLQVKFPLQSKYILSHIDIIFHVVKGGYSSLSWNFQSINFNWQMNFLLYLNFVRGSVGYFNVILSFFVQSIQL